jgi:hemerythrin-like metal-binding protein
MDNAFQWNDRYSVKVYVMDVQHKRLFEIIHELYTAMHSGHGKDVVGGVLQRLIDYTVQHFGAEEKLMGENKYPSLASHRVEHKLLTDKVLAFKKEFDTEKASITPELMTFLQSWLTNHIQAVDQKYSEFLNSKGVR